MAAIKGNPRTSTAGTLIAAKASSKRPWARVLRRERRKGMMTVRSKPRMSWRGRRNGGGAVGLALAVWCLGPARAQDASNEVALEELSVVGQGGAVTERATGPVVGYRATRSATGTKTDTALRDSPQTVNVIPRQVLADQADVRLGDAVQNVSNVQLGGTVQGRSQNYVIRGFRTQVFAVDGVLTSPAITFVPVERDLANAERVEVIKGPASVLFGRGDPGGVVNIVTRRPTLEPSGEMSVLGGSFGFRRLQGSVSSRVLDSDTVAGRISFAAQEDPTFRDIGRNTNSRYFVAPAFSWVPTADTRVYFNAEFSSQYSQYDEGLPAFRGRVPLDNIKRFYGEPWSRYYGAFNNTTLRVEHDVNANLTLRQVVNVQWGEFNVFAARATGVNAAGTQVTRRESTVDSVFAAVDTQSEAVLKFDTFGFAHTVLAGFEYSNGFRHPFSQEGALPSVSFRNPVFGARPVAVSLQADLKQKLELFGVYLQDQIALTPELQLVLGARFDFGTQFYFSRTRTSRTIPPDQDVFGASPRVGLIYRPFEPLTFYASYATSFAPQTANVLNVSNPAPETGEQVEAGARLDILPTLTLSMAGFRITRNNVAANDPVNTGFSVITGQQQARASRRIWRARSCRAGVSSAASALSTRASPATRSSPWATASWACRPSAAACGPPTSSGRDGCGASALGRASPMSASGPATSTTATRSAATRGSMRPSGTISMSGGGSP